MLRSFSEMLRSRKGQGMTEYAVIVALVVGIAIVAFGSTGLGGAITTLFADLATTIGAAF